jgi:hypothetical protein
MTIIIDVSLLPNSSVFYLDFECPVAKRLVPHRKGAAAGTALDLDEAGARVRGWPNA